MRKEIANAGSRGRRKEEEQGEGGTNLDTITFLLDVEFALLLAIFHLLGLGGFALVPFLATLFLLAEIPFERFLEPLGIVLDLFTLGTEHGLLELDVVDNVLFDKRKT